MSPPQREAQIALVEQYAPLVRQIAKSFLRKLPRNVLADDIIAAGMVGLWDAITRNGDMAQGFEWYARTRIRGAIIDELRTEDWLPRRLRSDASTEGAHRYPAFAPFRLEDLSEREQEQVLSVGSDIEEETAARARHEALLKAFSVLRPRTREILMRHLSGERMGDIAKSLGLTEPRISQIRAGAIRKLQQNKRLCSR